MVRLTEALRLIEMSATRMAQMIDGLMDVSSLRCGDSLSVHRSTVDLSALVRATVEANQGTTDRHRIDVDAPDHLCGWWDEPRIARVVDNLVTNALKYSPAGGVVLISVREDALPTRMEAVLTVTDTGIGIPASDRDFIFNTFYRGTNVGTEVSGSGIGLAGVRQIAEMHGGTALVESVEGAGSTFTVQLPLGVS